LPVRWVGIKIGGGAGWIVTTFKVSYTFDGISWFYVDNEKLFTGVSANADI